MQRALRTVVGRSAGREALIRPVTRFSALTGLAAMFVLTGVAHFVGKRAELVAMVPPFLPAPELLVTVTGVLELTGAVGLVWSRTAPWAAGGLSALLVAMFPAERLQGADRLHDRRRRPAGAAHRAAGGLPRRDPRCRLPPRTRSPAQ
jgi:uncharacterized membrane protein